MTANFGIRLALQEGTKSLPMEWCTLDAVWLCPRRSDHIKAGKRLPMLPSLQGGTNAPSLFVRWTTRPGGMRSRFSTVTRIGVAISQFHDGLVPGPLLARCCPGRVPRHVCCWRKLTLERWRVGRVLTPTGRRAVRVCVSDVTEYLGLGFASFRLDVGRPDYLAPLFGFFGDELAEIGR
jgi:hypothetical protein